MKHAKTKYRNVGQNVGQIKYDTFRHLINTHVPKLSNQLPKLRVAGSSPVSRSLNLTRGFTG